jgi:hypothetical protein
VDETIKKLEQQDEKLDAIYASAEKTRKYLLWTLTITVAVIVAPLIGLPFAIPMFAAGLLRAGAHPMLVKDEIRSICNLPT